MAGTSGWDAENDAFHLFTQWSFYPLVTAFIVILPCGLRSFWNSDSNAFQWSETAQYQNLALCLTIRWQRIKVEKEGGIELEPPFNGGGAGGTPGPSMHGSHLPPWQNFQFCRSGAEPGNLHFDRHPRWLCLRCPSGNLHTQFQDWKHRSQFSCIIIVHKSLWHYSL